VILEARNRRLSSALVLVMLSASCSSVPAHYYSLVPQAPGTANSTSDPIIVAVSTTIPPIVDRMQMVSHVSPAQVRVNEAARWAVSLREQLPQVLISDLQARYPAWTFVSARQAVAVHPSIRLAIDIETFDAEESERTQVRARWTLSGSPEKRVLISEADAGHPLQHPGAEGMVLAWSADLNDLSATIGQSVQRYHDMPGGSHESSR
jgi:uncharacterized lipoprotein YmbA